MHRTITSLFLFCAISTVVPLRSSAAPITVPTNLSVGDKYRLVFMTSTARDATSSNIADYNAFVTAAATSVPKLAALGTTWTAIASTPDISAVANTDTNPYQTIGVPIYRLDGTRIADGNADLWDGSILAPININELGEDTQGFVWTGSHPDGIAWYLFELGGIYNGIAILGSTAGLFPTGPEWIYDFEDTVSAGHPLYGISAELTVVPEPGAMTLMGIGAAAVVGWHFRGRRQANPK